MRSTLTNPYLKKISSLSDVFDGRSATFEGIAIKIVFFLLLTAAGVATYVLNIIPAQYEVLALMIFGIITIVTPFINYFTPKSALLYGSLFCISEGYISAFLCTQYSDLYHGIVPIALAVTFGVIFTMLLLYITKIIKVNQKFKAVISTLFLTTILFVAIVFISYIFTPVLANFVLGNSVFGIGIGLVMLVVASLNIVVDFDNIAISIKNGYSNKYEWSLAFGVVMSTIIIFIRVLVLLARFKSDD